MTAFFDSLFPPPPVTEHAKPRLLSVLWPPLGRAEEGYVIGAYELDDWNDTEEVGSEAELLKLLASHVPTFAHNRGLGRGYLEVTARTSDGFIRRCIIDILPYNEQDFFI